MTFNYKAFDAGGTQVEGIVDADTEDIGLRRLQSQGLVILSFGSAKGRAVKARAKTHGSSGQRVKLDQVVMLMRELAIMVETGVPISEALEVLALHADNAAIKNAITRAHGDLVQGLSISQAFGAQPIVFPIVVVNMVKTAEAGGSLDAALNQAAEYLESSLEMRNKVATALTYPALLAVVALGVTIFMMLYLIPKFGPLFMHMGGTIPPSTQFLLAVSSFLRTNWWIIPTSLFGAASAFGAMLRVQAGREALTRFLHFCPVVGDIGQKVALARILRSLGAVTASGVSLLLALEISGQSAQDIVFERAVSAARTAVAEGLSLSQAAINTKTFPPMVCQMISVGEKSGRLSDVMLRMARYYERDVDVKLKMLTSIIEPMMIVVMGLVIGFISVAIISPIYSLIGGVK
jgi:type IV pilus assembly protein PilC